MHLLRLRNRVRFLYMEKENKLGPKVCFSNPTFSIIFILGSTIMMIYAPLWVHSGIRPCCATDLWCTESLLTIGQINRTIETGMWQLAYNNFTRAFGLRRYMEAMIK